MHTAMRPPAGNPQDLLSQLRSVKELTDLLKDPDTKRVFDQFHDDVSQWMSYKDEIRKIGDISTLETQASAALIKASEELEAVQREAKGILDQAKSDADGVRARAQTDTDGLRSLIREEDRLLDERSAEIGRKEAAAAESVENAAHALRSAAAKESAAEAFRAQMEEKHNKIRELFGDLGP